MKNTIKKLLLTLVLISPAYATINHTIPEILAQTDKMAKVAQAILENPEVSDTDIKSLVYRFVLFDEKIYGSALAFNPDVLSKYPRLSAEKHNGHLLYSPYMYRKTPSSLSFINIGHIRPNQGYDYTTKQWYAKPAKTSQPGWSDVYIDTGAGNVKMLTYSVPVENLAVFTFDLTDSQENRREVRTVPSKSSGVIN